MDLDRQYAGEVFIAASGEAQFLDAFGIAPLDPRAAT